MMRRAIDGESRAAARVAATLCVALSCGTFAAAQSDPPVDSGRVARMNTAFLDWVDSLGPERSLVATRIREGFERSYHGTDEEPFIPDALAQLDPDFAAALAAFDAGNDAEALRLFTALEQSDVAYVAANATYFAARANAALDRHEEVLAQLADLDGRAELLAIHTPYAPHLWLLRAASAARALDFPAAVATLDELAGQFDALPETVDVGATQVRLEIERRERGTLGEVASVMDYVADRLDAEDGADRVRERQEEIVAMLDKLIEQLEQQEQQQGGGKGSRQRGGSKEGNASPQNPLETSKVNPGAGQVGDLHDMPDATPGEIWGKLPPAEREKILQSIRERFPSRYRQIVEQYYRSLAEDK